MWAVAGLRGRSARVVSQARGGPAYGGTPSDARRGPRSIQRPEGPRPRGGPVSLRDDGRGGRQRPAGPVERARRASRPIPGAGASPATRRPGASAPSTASAAAATQIAAFFGTAAAGDFAVASGAVSYSGPAEWSFRRHILHYAHLAQAAGGVDGFVIGSELVGLTRVRSAAGVYPAVAQLCTLAADVRAVLGPCDEDRLRRRLDRIRRPCARRRRRGALPARSAVVARGDRRGRHRLLPADRRLARRRGPRRPCRGAQPSMTPTTCAPASPAGRPSTGTTRARPIGARRRARRSPTAPTRSPGCYRAKDLVGLVVEPAYRAGRRARDCRDRVVAARRSRSGSPRSAFRRSTRVPTRRTSFPIRSRPRTRRSRRSRAAAATTSSRSAAWKRSCPASTPRSPAIRPARTRSRPSTADRWSTPARCSSGPGTHGRSRPFRTSISSGRMRRTGSLGHWITGRLEGHRPSTASSPPILADLGLAPATLAVDGFLDGYVIDRARCRRARRSSRWRGCSGSTPSRPPARSRFNGRGRRSATALAADDLVKTGRRAGLLRLVRAAGNRAPARASRSGSPTARPGISPGRRRIPPPCRGTAGARRAPMPRSSPAALSAQRSRRRLAPGCCEPGARRPSFELARRHLAVEAGDCSSCRPRPVRGSTV